MSRSIAGRCGSLHRVATSREVFCDPRLAIHESRPLHHLRERSFMPDGLNLTHMREVRLAASGAPECSGTVAPALQAAPPLLSSVDSQIVRRQRVSPATMALISSRRILRRSILGKWTTAVLLVQITPPLPFAAVCNAESRLEAGQSYRSA
jgi:hypothetical protein